MKEIMRFAKKLLGIYELNMEYWVSLSEIKIQPSFKLTLIGKEKYKRKWRFYRRNGYCESPILLTRDWVLVDGYSSYVIYKIAEGKDAKIPVYFVD